MDSTPTLPLITLQPVSDAHHLWTAFLLRGDPSLDQGALTRIFNGYGLAEILHWVNCEVAADPAMLDQAFLDSFPPGRLALHPAGIPLPDPAAPGAAPAALPKGDPTARSLLLKLLSLVTSDADSAEIEAVIKRDPNLSYQLLKLVNSVAFAPGKKITNFMQAIALLGRRQLQRWLQLLLYARPHGSPVASPLLPKAALRAGLMEALAKRDGLSHEMQDHAFMVGMFSLLDALFGQPLAEIITPLNLSEDIFLALTEGGGPLGALLAVIRAGEGLPTPELATRLEAAGISRETWAAALAEAVRWAVQVSREA